MIKRFASEPLLKTTSNFIQSEDISQQRIAFFGVDPNLRMNAVSNLTTQDFIENIAKHDSSSLVREVAVTRLIDKDLQLNLSQTDKNERVREAALSRFLDIHFLSRKRT